MYMLFADEQVYHSYRQHYREEYERRGRGVGRISSAVVVQHIVHVSDDCVHVRRVEIGAEKRHGVFCSSYTEKLVRNETSSDFGTLSPIFRYYNTECI